jgi:hypothetical protein
LALLAPLPVSAGCSANLTCSNSCSIIDFMCPSPYCCDFSCFAPNQNLSCTGSTDCHVGTNSVTCDGNTYTCATNQCFTGPTSITCGSTTKTCSHSCFC